MQDSPERVVLQYKNETATYSVTGVCSADSEGVSCWRPDGTIDSQLTLQVQRSLSKAKYLQTMPLSPNQKTRLVVFERRTGVNRGFGSFDVYSSMSRDSGIWNHTLRSEQVQEGDESTSAQTDLYGIRTPLTAETGSLFLRFSVGFMATQRLEPTIGSARVLTKWKLTLARIQRLPDLKDAQSHAPSRQWELDLQLDGPQPFPSVQLFAEDKAHKYIQYVDKDGKPVTQAQYLAEQAKKPSQYKYRNVGMYSRPVDKDGNVKVVCPIDPARIGGLGVSGSEGKWVEITGFALDPKPTVERQ